VAKTLIINQYESTRVPFLRGILTRSLQDAGLTFEDAYRLASSIRDDLSDVSEVSSKDLRAIVVARLQDGYPTAVAESYESSPVPPATILIVNEDGQTTPFSRGQLRQSIESAGFSATDAAATTSRVYESLLKDGVRELDSGRLAHLAYQYLRQDHGKSLAQRYVVWTEFRRSGRPLLLLIGGTVGCGKSTIAAEISHRLDIVRTQSTDMLREVMRMMIPERLMPILHTSSFKAWQALPFVGDDTPHDRLLTEGFQSQAELLVVPCEAVLNRALNERVSMILEGVHVRPALLQHIRAGTDAIVICIMLAVMSPKALRRRLKGRSSVAVQRRAERYLKHFEAIWQIQSFLLSEADQHDVPIVANDARAKASQQVMATINEAMSREFSGSPAEVFGPRKPA
jgi:2-phosphoglycerate kinase